ncbi:hypothetical protein [Cardinium endosymbiont of Philonthus spinipes]|uniref:hypothetical protein n=1 Tax=Cardinium endosymbiont of Philonthus spinipes TaxID=3077941 RepID=UPI00313DC8D8
MLLKYFRKSFVFLWLFGVCSCKDFKSWESSYTPNVQIALVQEKDGDAPAVVKDLHSIVLEKFSWTKRPVVTRNDSCFLFSSTSELTIPLNPNADTVSFEVENIGGIYYHKITIYYDRIVSLISPEAGGLQIQYVIKRIQLSTKNTKRPIFKKYTIDNPVPLKAEKNQTHVTLYY